VVDTATGHSDPEPDGTLVAGATRPNGGMVETATGIGAEPGEAGTRANGGTVETAGGHGADAEPDGRPTAVGGWARARQAVRESATEVSWVGAWVVLALGSLRLGTVSNEAGHLRLLHVVNLIAGMLLVTPVLLGAPGRGWVRWLLTRRPIVSVGLASYGVYLWHLDLFIHLPGPWVAEPSGPALAGMAAKVGVAIAAGTVSFFLLERPLMRWAATRRTGGHP
jgi:peptidoglycan/LPS O-acetylase OafA/YrhL